MDLKVMPIIMFAEVTLPLWGTNACLCTLTNYDITSVDNTVKSPTEHADVVPIGTDACRVIRAVTIIDVNGVEELSIMLLTQRSVYHISILLPTHMTPHVVVVWSAYGVWMEKHYLLFVTPSCTLNNKKSLPVAVFISNTASLYHPLGTEFLAPLESLRNGTSRFERVFLSVGVRRRPYHYKNHRTFVLSYPWFGYE
jgi:hypothetical protein